MFSLKSARKDLSICARCQFRVFLRCTRETPYQFASRGAHDLTKKYGRSAKFLDLTEQQVDLGVYSLGQPAQIRIVRDRIRRPRKAQDGQSDSTARAREKSPGRDKKDDISEVLVPDDTSRKTESWKENIESLRISNLVTKAGKNVMSDAQATKIAKELYEGFTATQLKKYLEQTDQYNVTEKPNDLSRCFESAQLQRSRWFVGTSQFPESAVGRLSRENEPKGMDKPLIPLRKNKEPSPKQKLAETILRTCWKIKTQSEISFGELDIRVDPLILGVLLKNDQLVFEAISQRFNIQINISQEYNIIRFSGEYDLTSDAFELLSNFVASVRREQMTIRGSSMSQIVKNLSLYVSEVESLTNTRLILSEHHGDEKQTLEVWYLENNETALSDVKRLMALAYDYSSTLSEAKVLCYNRLSDLETIMAPIIPTSVLPLQQRLSQWYRLYSATRSSKETKNKQQLVETHLNHSLSHLIGREELKKASRYLADGCSRNIAEENTKTISKDVTCNRYWTSRASLQIHGQLGYIAVSTTPQSVTECVSSKRRKLRENDQELMVNAFKNSFRTLLTNIPGQTRLIEKRTSEARVRNEFIINLCPSSNLDALFSSHSPSSLNTIPRAPNLQLTVSIDSEMQSIALASAAFILPGSSISDSDHSSAPRSLDLLLPDRAADIRFAAWHTLSSGSEIDPKLSAFIEASSLEIWGEGQIQTPKRLTVKVPTAAMQEVRVESGNAETNGGGRGATVVEYVFESLEHRSVLEMEYEGHMLCYATAEAGKARGRSEEVRLIMGKLDEGDRSKTGDGIMSTFREAKLRDFMDKSLKLVNEIGNGVVR